MVMTEGIDLVKDVVLGAIAVYATSLMVIIDVRVSIRGAVSEVEPGKVELIEDVVTNGFETDELEDACKSKTLCASCDDDEKLAPEMMDEGRKLEVGLLEDGDGLTVAEDVKECDTMMESCDLKADDRLVFGHFEIFDDVST